MAINFHSVNAYASRLKKTFLVAVSEVCHGKLDALDQSFDATHYELIQGIVQHDAYYLGQATIVKKIVASEEHTIV